MSLLVYKNKIIYVCKRIYFFYKKGKQKSMNKTNNILNKFKFGDVDKNEAPYVMEASKTKKAVIGVSWSDQHIISCVRNFDKMTR